MKIVASVAVVAVLAVVAFAAFGSSSNNSVDPVAVAATRSTSTPGFKMLMNMKISSPALPAAVTGSGTGSFDSKDHSGTFTLTLVLPKTPALTGTLGTNQLKLNEIFHGGTIYMQLPAVLRGALGETPGKTWIALNLAKVSGVPGLGSLTGNPASSDPSEMLQYLRAAGSNVSVVGHEVVDGVPTTHYHAGLSLSGLSKALPAAERAALQQALSKLRQQAHVNQIPVDAWVDSNHLVRRIQMNVNPSTQGQSVNEQITIDIPQYGPQSAPAVPPASEVQTLNVPAG
jgi:hypothetical protein